jgi:hypothetical protein
MSIASRLRHSLVVSRFTVGATADERGHRSQTWTDQPAVAGWLQEVSSHEVNAPEFGGVAISDAIVFLAIGTVLTARDRIVFGAASYEVLGTPRDAGGRGRHLEAALRRLTP